MGLVWSGTNFSTVPCRWPLVKSPNFPRLPTCASSSGTTISHSSLRDGLTNATLTTTPWMQSQQRSAWGTDSVLTSISLFTKRLVPKFDSVGQNLYQAMSSKDKTDAPVVKGVGAWYAEIVDYSGLLATARSTVGFTFSFLSFRPIWRWQLWPLKWKKSDS